ncbi:helix-turn-helix domain-containing protein [Natrialba swarupiae]|uniref:helix-turn-helix domain-containing protein n=1 Tax=Natrialba swarupiae TaxID=2448032 RepID=UPI001390B580|nr:helix-turn-helix domain-containing protein [Natrialba swarupiae]
MNYVRTRLRPSTPEPAERTAEDESGERRNGPDDWSDESGGGDGSGRRGNEHDGSDGSDGRGDEPGDTDDRSGGGRFASGVEDERQAPTIGTEQYDTPIADLAGSEGVDTVHLLAGGVADTDTPTYTLSIEADEATVHRVLESDPDVLEWEIASAETGVVYAYVRFRAPPGVGEIRERFTSDSLVVLLPVTFHPDSVELTVVGTQSDLSSAFETLPSALEATVLEVGTYRESLHRGRSLTERQREVLAVAYELGYYDQPSETSHEQIADRLECAPSTVGEHLRKAEKRLVSELFEDSAEGMKTGSR